MDKYIDVNMTNCELVGNLSSNKTMSGFINNACKIEGTISIGNGEVVDTYEGDYVVSPKIRDQILETRNKKMLEDVVVEKVPYYETSNTSGTTVYIGIEVGE